MLLARQLRAAVALTLQRHFLTERFCGLQTEAISGRNALQRVTRPDIEHVSVTRWSAFLPGISSACVPP